MYEIPENWKIEYYDAYFTVDVLSDELFKYLYRFEVHYFEDGDWYLKENSDKYIESSDGFNNYGYKSFRMSLRQIQKLISFYRIFDDIVKIQCTQK